MTSTTLERVRRNLKLCDIPYRLFAQIVQMPVSSLKEAFLGDRYVGAETEARWYEISCRLVEYIDIMRPFLINDGEAWRRILKNQTAESLKLAMVALWGEE